MLFASGQIRLSNDAKLTIVIIGILKSGCDHCASLSIIYPAQSANSRCGNYLKRSLLGLGPTRVTSSVHCATHTLNRLIQDLRVFNSLCLLQRDIPRAFGLEQWRDMEKNACWSILKIEWYYIRKKELYGARF